jgi:hypothetical protein
VGVTGGPARAEKYRYTTAAESRMVSKRPRSACDRQPGLITAPTGPARITKQSLPKNLARRTSVPKPRSTAMKSRFRIGDRIEHIDCVRRATTRRDRRRRGSLTLNHRARRAQGRVIAYPNRGVVRPVSAGARLSERCSPVIRLEKSIPNGSRASTRAPIFRQVSEPRHVEVT